MASSAGHRLHSVTDRWRSSLDKATSAVQNVAGASFFLLFVAIKKKNKGWKDRILEKEEEEEKGSHCISKLQPEGVVCKHMRFLCFTDSIHLKYMYFRCFTLHSMCLNIYEKY